MYESRHTAMPGCFEGRPDVRHYARGLTQLNLIFSILFDTVLFWLDVVGEYVGRVFEEVKNCPLFVVLL